MEYRSSRNRKGQTGLNYGEFRPAAPVKKQDRSVKKADKSDRFTSMLFVQTVAAATILTVFTVIRMLSFNFYGELDAGMTASSFASKDIGSTTKQAIHYIQTSETFSQLFPSTQNGQGNSTRWTSVILSDTTKSASTPSQSCVCPVKYIQITSDFGERTDPFTGKKAAHNGLDMAVDEGSSVVAAWSGTVLACANDPIGGNYIIIDHASGMSTYYGHLSEILVESGQTVTAGERIALSGNTGKSTGPHLHFEVAYNGEPVDPTDYLNV